MQKKNLTSILAASLSLFTPNFAQTKLTSENNPWSQTISQPINYTNPTRGETWTEGKTDIYVSGSYDPSTQKINLRYGTTDPTKDQKFLEITQERLFLISAPGVALDSKQRLAYFDGKNPAKTPELKSLEDTKYAQIWRGKAEEVTDMIIEADPTSAVKGVPILGQFIQKGLAEAVKDKIQSQYDSLPSEIKSQIAPGDLEAEVQEIPLHPLDVPNPLNKKIFSRSLELTLDPNQAKGKVLPSSLYLVMRAGRKGAGGNTTPSPYADTTIEIPINIQNPDGKEITKEKDNSDLTGTFWADIDYPGNGIIILDINQAKVYSTRRGTDKFFDDSILMRHLMDDGRLDKEEIRDLENIPQEDPRREREISLGFKIELTGNKLKIARQEIGDSRSIREKNLEFKREKIEGDTEIECLDWKEYGNLKETHNILENRRLQKIDSHATLGAFMLRLQENRKKRE